jgi:hypothetical protein
MPWLFVHEVEGIKDLAPGTDNKWETSRAFSSVLQIVNAGTIGVTTTRY